MMSKPEQTVVKEPNFIVRYYRETVGELKKVAWPTWQEARMLTTIVLVVIVLAAMFFGLGDYLFNQLIALLLSIS